MNASRIAETVSAIDAALSYLIDMPYTTTADYAKRREVLMNLSGSKGALLGTLREIEVEVSHA